MAAEEPSSPHGSPDHQARCRILLVDDHHEQSLDLARLFARHSYAMAWADDSGTAVKTLDEGHCCAIAICKDLQESEFESVVKHVREHHAGMPIVVFSRGEIPEQLEFATAQLGDAKPPALFAVLDCVVQEIEAGV